MNERQTEGVISKRFYKLLDTLLIQSQVFQSSLWNTISPHRSKSSIESHSKGANPGYGFPLDSDGQPDKQRYRGKKPERIKTSTAVSMDCCTETETWVKSPRTTDSNNDTGTTPPSQLQFHKAHPFHHPLPDMYIQVLIQVGNVSKQT